METISRGTARRILILLVLAGAVWLFLMAFAMRHGFFDLKVYYGAIRYWAHGRGEIYDYLKPNTKYGFTYPPFAMLTMLPMAVLPWPVVVTISWLGTGAATVAVLYWLLGPTIRERGWTPWFVLAAALLLSAVFEPMRETVNFGQVNMLLVFLVVADFAVFIEAGRRWGGVAIGLATAIKLTPGVFILYLLVARKFREAAVAAATATGATLLAMAVAPDASREFWTSALWDTDRIGTLSFISNQSWQGMVARLNPARPSTALWAALVLVTLAMWAWRARRAVSAGDLRTGLALTGVLGCLISPVTWVHHLVWLLPAVLLLVVRALRATGRRRVALLAFAIVLYALLSSRLVWFFAFHFRGWGLLGSNAYLIASLALLFALPGASRPAGGRTRPAGHADGRRESTDRAPQVPADRADGTEAELPVDPFAVR